MRADMFKVIVERPRGGRRHAPKLKTPRDDRSWMPVSRGRGTKGLNENLAPLLRFLRKSVGRSWNAVFAEICESLSVRSAVQKHVRDHLRDLVRLDVLEIDGALWYRRYQLHKLERGARDTLYRCPRSGLLRLLPALPHKLRAQRNSGVAWVRADEAAMVFQDQWWLITVRPITAFPVWDVMLQCELRGEVRTGCWQTRRLYGRELVVGVARRALGRAEVKRLGLKRP